MVRNSIRSFVKLLDFYPKFREDNQKKTIFGGIVAIISFLIIILLFILKFSLLLSTPPTKKFYVDTNFIPRTSSNKLNESAIPKIKMDFDISFYHLPCVFMRVDVLDYIKESTTILDAKIQMQRYSNEKDLILEKIYPTNEKIETNDTYCGPCFSLKSGCCNTCEEVRQLFNSKLRLLPSIASIDQCTRGEFLSNISKMINESCRLHGSILTRLHPGYISIGPDKTIINSAIYKKLNINFNEINISHKINRFSFGSQLYDEHSSLDDKTEIQMKKGKMKVFYFIKIVPIGLDGISFTYGSSSFQTYQKENSKKFPSVLFKYDISPISVIDAYNFTFSNFISQFIEIVGGVYAIATFIDLFSSACLHFLYKDEDDVKLL